MHARSFGWQKSVERIARLRLREVASPPGDLQRTLARKKSVAPPDAGRGWAEGETVCAHADTITSCPRARASASSGSRGSLDTTEGVLGLSPARPSPAGRSEALWLTGQAASRGSVARPHLDDGAADRAEKDSGSGVPASDEENVRGRHGSVKALQGPRRSTGSPHPRRSKWRRSQRCTAPSFG